MRVAPKWSRDWRMHQGKVIIFMATYNGQCFLDEQLDSIAKQTYKNIEVWVSDDGSSDETYNILKKHQTYFPKNSFFIQSGPRKGFVANFLSLVCTNAAKSDYYAYADQDDYWKADKIQKAVDCLSQVSSHQPAMYCSRAELIDKHGKRLGYSNRFSKEPSFLNALVQNICSGNTILMNQKARELLTAAGSDVNVICHDWWSYLLVMGAGGKIIYDPSPMIGYRQHPMNLIGGKIGLSARFLNVCALFKGRFKAALDKNLSALQANQHLLIEQNRLVLHQFSLLREGSRLFALIKIKQLGIHRQTVLGNISLIIGAIFKKI
jgi:glycosyltransferase involved in cell wall biosynthesis